MELRNIRSQKSLVSEDITLTAAAYLIFALFCLKLISFFFLQVALIVYVLRVFNLRHERAHLPPKSRSSKLSSLFDFIEMYHTPYQEPFLEKRRKHLVHHLAHLGRNKYSTLENPHRLIESSFFGALFSSLFYHEVMLATDLVRERRLSHTRVVSFVVSTLMIAATITLSGFQNFFAFFIAYRISSCIAWFSFSYVLHLDDLYKIEAGSFLPKKMKTAIEYVFGSGFVTAVFYHRFHHERPNQFIKF